MPTINGLLETFLFVENVEISYRFFQNVLGLTTYSEPDERGCFFILPGKQMLGIMHQTEAATPNPIPKGLVPACSTFETEGPNIGHLAFKVTENDLRSWIEHLKEQNVEIEEVTEWGQGGRSVYFRDPDGHLIELVTPGIWKGVY